MNDEQIKVLDKEINELREAIKHNSEKISSLERDNNRLNKRIQLLKED